MFPSVLLLTASTLTREIGGRAPRPSWLSHSVRGTQRVRGFELLAKQAQAKIPSDHGDRLEQTPSFE